MSEFVSSRRDGRIQHIVLDRPKALNSLDLSMCRALHTALDEAANDEGIEAVVTTSTSEKAFCAGGDVKPVREAALDGALDTVHEYFANEYRLDQLVAAQLVAAPIEEVHRLADQQPLIAGCRVVAGTDTDIAGLTGE